MHINGVVYDPSQLKNDSSLLLPDHLVRRKTFASELCKAPITIAHANGTIYDIGKSLYARQLPITGATINQELNGMSAGHITGVHVDQAGRVHITAKLREGLIPPATARRLSLSLTHTISQCGNYIQPVEVGITAQPARGGCNILDTVDHPTYLAKLANMAEKSLPPRDSTGKFTAPEKTETPATSAPTENIQALFAEFMESRNKAAPPAAPPAAENSAPATEEKATTPAATEPDLASFIAQLPANQQQLVLDGLERVGQKMSKASEAEKDELNHRLSELMEKYKALEQSSSSMKVDAELQKHLINDLVETIGPEPDKRAEIEASVASGLQGPGALALFACTAKLRKLQTQQQIAQPDPVKTRLARLGLLGEEAPSVPVPAGMTAASLGARRSAEDDNGPPAKRMRLPELARSNVTMFETLHGREEPKPSVYY
jgi:chemotaxis protein histidine kinase CheA